MTDSRTWFANRSDLSEIHDEVWQRLAAAPADPQCGWRLAVLATADPKQVVRQRTVVLRRVEPATRTVYIHTDVRSGKIRSLQQQPECSWLVYDAQSQVQVILTGTATIYATDDVADDFWNEQPEAGLRCYLGPLAPGTVCEKPDFNLPESVQGRIPERHELAEGRSRFAVISSRIHTVEWLSLSREGHLRAKFEIDGDEVRGVWLAP